jgi:enamine deaminase RidA (YjgF/YER057c/UK114 family)
MTRLQSYSHNVSGEREFGFAQAVKVGGTIYVSGQLSHDEEGNFIHANDFDAQVKQTFANLDKVLDHFGVTRNQIVQDTVFVVNLREHNKAVAAAHLEYFGEHRPTSTTVGAEALFFPGQLIEINVIISTDLEA